MTQPLFPEVTTGIRRQASQNLTEQGRCKSMPQLEFHDFAPQLVWLVITFVGLYLVMARMALPRIADVIEERRDRIQRDLDEAERLKEETELAIAAYEEALAKARAKAHAIAQDTRDNLNAQIEKDRQKVDSEIAKSMASAENRIQSAKTEALAHVNEVASDTASALVEKLIGLSQNKDDIKNAIKSLNK